MPKRGGSGRDDLKPRAAADGFKSRLAGVGKLLGRVSVLEYSDEVATEQASYLARLIRTSWISGNAIALVLVIYFRPPLAGVLLAVVILPIFYAGLFLQSRGLVGERYTHKVLRRTVVLLCCVGAAWGGLVLVLGLHATSVQKDLLTGVMVGLIATVLTTGPFVAALAFFVPVGLASLLTVSVVYKPFEPSLLICFVVYLLFVYSRMAMLNRISLEGTVTRLRLKQQNEVTNLFLRNSRESRTDWSWEVGADLTFRNISRRLALALKAIPTMARRGNLRDLAKPEGPLPSFAPLIAQFDKRQAFRDIVVEIGAGADMRWWSFTGQPLYDSNAHFSGFRGMVSDITELRRSESRVQHLAKHDSLTSLPNRASFIAQLEASCRDAASRSEPCFALLLLDLDRFKDVNDVYGHPVGDALLVALAERLARVLRGGDMAFRLGGDEFAIVLEIADASEAGAAADRIIAALEEPYVVQGVRLNPGASIGLTFGPTDGADPDSLLRNADLALYKSKAAGGSTWRSYQPGMEVEQAESADLRNALRGAAEQDFEVEYQPIVEVATGRIVSAEALLRWNHPTRGRIEPSIFIPIAEASGLISTLGVLVLNRGCLAAAEWPPHVRLAVNVSALQIRDPDFLPSIERALKASGLAPERLEMEFTEGVLLPRDETSFQTIQELERRGIGIVLDDFGTGYSSLATLIRFHFSTVKIDAYFTANMETDERSRAVVLAIGRFAAAAGGGQMVVAEGVERPEQLEQLLTLGIPLAQGYLTGPPQSAEVLLHRLRAQEAVGAAPPEGAIAAD